jgi:dihydroflavonol-4-reductase
MLMVTGATGYLGSVLVAELVRDGREVRVVVRDEELGRRLLPPDVQLVRADVTDEAAMTAAARGCDAVLHLAATVGGTPEQIRTANVEGTRSVLAGAVAAGVGRFVLTSSGAAVMDASGLMSENPVAPPALTDAYSRSKAESEAIALRAGGIDVVVASPCSLYGPSPRGPQSYNGLFRAAAAGEIERVVDAPMAWVHVEDAAHGHVLVLDHGVAGRRYLLVGEVAPFGRVLHAYADAVGGVRVPLAPPGTDLGPDASTFAKRSQVYRDFPPVHVDDAGARGLGFTPRGISEGIAQTAAWMG